MKKFYNESDIYAENLRNLDIEWYKGCLDLFSGYFPERNRLILDLGCGVGTTTRYLGDRFRMVIGLDYSRKFCKYSRKSKKPGNSGVYINSDVCFLPIKSEQVDGIFSFATIEHLYDVGEALEEMHRVMKKGGIILIHMPNLLSPLRPLKAILSRERLRNPKPESGKNFLHSTYLIFRDIFLILKKYASRDVAFIYREPNFEIIEGDYDAVYLSSPIDIKKYFQRRNYEINDLTYTYRPYSGNNKIMRGIKWLMYKTGILQMIKMSPGTYSTLLLRKG